MINIYPIYLILLNNFCANGLSLRLLNFFVLIDAADLDAALAVVVDAASFAVVVDAAALAVMVDVAFFAVVVDAAALAAVVDAASFAVVVDAAALVLFHNK